MNTTDKDVAVSPVDLPDNPKRWSMRVAFGAIVGVGAILPGVSGGAFCAAFGIYRPLMEFIAHPGKNFKKNMLYFIPFGIGGLLGFILLARLIGWLLSLAAVVVTAFFMGCIIGTMPSLFKEAEGRSWKAGHWITMAVTTVLAIIGLLAMNSKFDLQSLIVEPRSLSNLTTWVVCGAVFALGFIVPGMSPSSLIMCAGLYKPMSDGIGMLKMDVLLPFALGGALCVLLFSKLVTLLFSKSVRYMFSFVIGVVFASTIMVFYEQILIPIIAGPSLITIAGSLLSAAAGAFLVYYLAKLDPR